MKSKIAILVAVFSLTLGYHCYADNISFDSAELTKDGKYLISGNWTDLKLKWNTLVLRITDLDNVPVQGATVSVAYDMVGMSMHPPFKPVQEKDGGLYEKPVFFGMTGNWKFDITVNKGSIEDVLSRIVLVQK